VFSQEILTKILLSGKKPVIKQENDGAKGDPYGCE
jgi:hypothetical protein